MINKKWLFLGIIILIIAIIAVFVFYFFNKQDLCKKINDEALKQKCLACESAENPVDCKDSVYVEFAFLKKDLSLCEDLTKEHKRIECRVNLEKSILRGSGVPNLEPLESGGYRKVS